MQSSQPTALSLAHYFMTEINCETKNTKSNFWRNMPNHPKIKNTSVKTLLHLSFIKFTNCSVQAEAAQITTPSQAEAQTYSLNTKYC